MSPLAVARRAALEGGGDLRLQVEIARPVDGDAGTDPLELVLAGKALVADPAPVVEEARDRRHLGDYELPAQLGAEEPAVIAAQLGALVSAHAVRAAKAELLRVGGGALGLHELGVQKHVPVRGNA